MSQEIKKCNCADIELIEKMDKLLNEFGCSFADVKKQLSETLSAKAEDEIMYCFGKGFWNKDIFRYLAIKEKAELNENNDRITKTEKL